MGNCPGTLSHRRASKQTQLLASFEDLGQEGLLPEESSDPPWSPKLLSSNVGLTSFFNLTAEAGAGKLWHLWRPSGASSSGGQVGQRESLPTNQSHQPLAVRFSPCIPSRRLAVNWVPLGTLTHLCAGRKHVAGLSVGPKTSGQVLSASANSKMCCQYDMGRAGLAQLAWEVGVGRLSVRAHWTCW